MKRNLLALLLIMIHYSAVAGECSIRFHVVGAPPLEAITITVYDEPITWRMVTLDSVIPDRVGNATLRFSVDHPQAAEIHVGEQYAKLFLEPGMELSIDVEYARFDSTINHKGLTAFNQKFLLLELLHDFSTPQTMYTLYNDARVYSDYIDSLQRAHLDFYKKSDTVSMTPAFREYIRMKIDYQYHYSRNMFSVLYDRETQQFSERELPERYYDNLKAIDLTRDEYVIDSDYNTAVDLYLSHYVISNWHNIVQTYGEIRQSLKGKVRDVHLAAYLRRQLANLVANATIDDSLVEDYQSLCTTPQYAAIVSKLYDVAKRLAPGKPIPDIHVLDVDGIEHSIKELRGKVVYIDVWATWCFPCIAAMNASNKLRSEFANEDVSFVYINYEDDITKWKKYSISNDLGTHNWFADAQHSEQIATAFDINGVPRYLIVNRDGTIVKSAAPGPDAVAGELLKLIQQK